MGEKEFFEKERKEKNIFIYKNSVIPRDLRRFPLTCDQFLLKVLYVLLWLNTVAAIQVFFVESIFVFFMTLFLKEMRTLNATNPPPPYYHSRLKKLILKILSIYRNKYFRETNFQSNML